MAASVTDPVSLSFGRMTRILFKPFDVVKWLTLGFAAWLATLAEGQGFNFRLPGPGGGPPVPGTTPAQELDRALQWILGNLYWLGPVALVLLGIGIALLWVRARGKFMLLDAVARDHAAVVEPWKRLRPLANSYFLFDLLLTVVAWGGLLAVIAGGVAIAWPDIQAGQFGPAAGLAVALGVFLIVFGVVAVTMIGAITGDFVMPLMYLREQSVWPAWGEFSGLLWAHFGSFVLFYLMKLLLGLATAMIMGAGMCLTCCLAALPYLGAVIFLPLYVFHRGYSLYFLRQFGEEYNVLSDVAPLPAFPVLLRDPPLPPGIPPGGQ